MRPTRDSRTGERTPGDLLHPVKPSSGGDGNNLRVRARWQLGNDGQRKIAAHAVDAGQQDPGECGAPDDSGLERKTPDRAGQEQIEPALTEIQAGLRDAALQPRIPSVPARFPPGEKRGSR